MHRVLKNLIFSWGRNPATLPHFDAGNEVIRYPPYASGRWSSLFWESGLRQWAPGRWFI